jgi:predicted Zn-dependent peptidase
MIVITSWNLAGGARLVVEEIPYVKSAAVGIYIHLGSRNETENISGASHFIEHMLFKGTPTRSARDIADSFEGMGGQLNAATAKENTVLYARILDENLYTAMDILFDMAFHSAFAPRDFETEKGVIIEEINMYEDTPDDLVHDIFSQHMWKESSMGPPILGTFASITNSRRDDLYNFYQQCYVPSNVVISVAGNVEAEKVKAAIEEHLARAQAGSVSLTTDMPEIAAPFVKLVPKETEQVQICLGVPGITYNDERRYALNIMNSILGGGVSSRLFQSIREELGLAYSIYSYPNNYSDTGSYVIYAGTGPARTGQCLEVLNQQLNEIVEKGISQEELTRTQQQIKSSLYLGMESVMNRMTRLGKSLLMYDKITPLEEVMDKIMRVEKNAVENLAAELLQPSLVSLAAIGSPEALKSVEEEFRRYW